MLTAQLDNANLQFSFTNPSKYIYHRLSFSITQVILRYLKKIRPKNIAWNVMPWDVIELMLQKKNISHPPFLSFFLNIADQRSAMKHLSYPFCVLNPVTGQTFWPFFLRGNLRGCESSTCARVKAAITWPGGQHFTCPPMFPERLSLSVYLFKAMNLSFF